MTWWTHILFGDYPENHNARLFKDEISFGVLSHVFRQYVYDHGIKILHFFLRVLIYCYLGIAVFAFFAPHYAPHSLLYIVDAFSEPYLGALGVYIVVKEIKRRRTLRGDATRPSRPNFELYPLLWFLFLVTSTIAIYYSEHYVAGTLYQTVVTDAFAVMIIRIGTLLRY